MSFRHPTQSEIVTPNQNIDTLPEGTPEVLNTLQELILAIPFEVPEGSEDLQPKVKTPCIVEGSRYGVETDGLTEIKVLITFFDCELTLIVPNHKNNLELLDKFTITILTGLVYPSPEKGIRKPIQPKKYFGVLGAVDVSVKAKRPEAVI